MKGKGENGKEESRGRGEGWREYGEAKSMREGDKEAERGEGERKESKMKDKK